MVEVSTTHIYLRKETKILFARSITLNVSGVVMTSFWRSSHCAVENILSVWFSSFDLASCGLVVASSSIDYCSVCGLIQGLIINHAPLPARKALPKQDSQGQVRRARRDVLAGVVGQSPAQGRRRAVLRGASLSHPQVCL